MLFGLGTPVSQADSFQEFSISAISCATQTENGVASSVGQYSVHVTPFSIFPSSFDLVAGYVHMPSGSTLQSPIEFGETLLITNLSDMVSSMPGGSYGFELHLTNGGSNASNHFVVTTNVVVSNAVPYEEPIQYPAVVDGVWSNSLLIVHQTCRIGMAPWINAPSVSHGYVELAMSSAGHSLSLSRGGTATTNFPFLDPRGPPLSPLTLKVGTAYAASLKYHYVVASTNFTVTPDYPVLFFPRAYDVGVKHVASTLFTVLVAPDPKLQMSISGDTITVAASNLIVNKTYQLASVTNLGDGWNAMLQMTATNAFHVLASVPMDIAGTRYFRLQWD